MNRLLLFSFIAFLTILLSCERLFIKPSENSPKEIFKTIWKNYDMYYSRFDVYSINWDSIYNVYDARVSDNMSENELYTIMCQMLDNLKGGHVWLISPYGFYENSSGKNYTYYYDRSVIATYLTNRNNNYMFNYGKLTDNIGYINISTFADDVSGYGYIDNILNELALCNGLVIDIRNNGGGDSGNAEFIAARFCDSKKEYGYLKTRNGGNYGDFTKNSYMFIEPENNVWAQKPVVLLTDNFTGSSAEDFTLMLKTLSNVTQVGDSTRGNLGCSPIMIELQNGWLCYVPNSLQYSMDGKLLLDKGIAPDILVKGIEPDRDLMIEKAIDLLK